MEKTILMVWERPFEGALRECQNHKHELELVDNRKCFCNLYQN